MMKNSITPKKPDSPESEVLEEILSGLKLYFDRSLGTILLYRYERQQYLTIKKTYPNKPASEIYGSEHLLRLFVSLPGLISQTNMDFQSAGVLKEHIEEFLKFLEKNQSVFVDYYSNTAPSYESLSMNS